MKTLNQIVCRLILLNYSQQELAKVAKVSQMTISRWRAKQPRRVDLLALRRLEKLLTDSEKVL